MRKHIKKCLRRLRRLILIFAVLCVLFNVAFRVIFVDGESMLPALENGDWILISRLATPRRGEIVVTNTDNAQQVRFIKRLIAVGGDVVDIDADGTVFVNGVALDEPYLKNGAFADGDAVFPLTVPDGCAFLLGDNRENSVDSRFTEVGCIPLQNIIGPVFLRLLPMPFQAV